MRTADRWVMMTAALLGLTGCSGGSARPEMPEGAANPEEAVDVFLKSSQDALLARRNGNLSEADRAYERMAAVFGTENGSIFRSHPADDVRSRMIVLAACLRPIGFRILSQFDPQAQRSGRTSVTVELTRGRETMNLPFFVVKGRQERWFIEQIEVSSFSC